MMRVLFFTTTAFANFCSLKIIDFRVNIKDKHRYGEYFIDIFQISDQLESDSLQYSKIPPISMSSFPTFEFSPTTNAQSIKIEIFSNKDTVSFFNLKYEISKLKGRMKKIKTHTFIPSMPGSPIGQGDMRYDFTGEVSCPETKGEMKLEIANKEERSNSSFVFSLDSKFSLSVSIRMFPNTTSFIQKTKGHLAYSFPSVERSIAYDAFPPASTNLVPNLEGFSFEEGMTPCHWDFLENKNMAMEVGTGEGKDKRPFSLFKFSPNEDWKRWILQEIISKISLRQRIWLLPLISLTQVPGERCSVSFNPRLTKADAEAVYSTMNEWLLVESSSGDSENSVESSSGDSENLVESSSGDSENSNWGSSGNYTSFSNVDDDISPIR